MAAKLRNHLLGLGAVVCVLFAISSVFSHVAGPNSGAGASLCIPGLSIRCEPDDCGSLYVRCGRHQKRQEVPANKVCYKGALVSIHSRMHSSGLLPHNCREKTAHRRNSTIEFDLKNCNCAVQCSGFDVCKCLCKSGSKKGITCKNGTPYANEAQADCCLRGAGKCKLGAEPRFRVLPWSWWTETLEFVRVVIRSSLKQVCYFLRERFTFPPTMEANACCSASSNCNHC